MFRRRSAVIALAMATLPCSLARAGERATYVKPVPVLTYGTFPRYWDPNPYTGEIVVFQPAPPIAQRDIALVAIVSSEFQSMTAAQMLTSPEIDELVRPWIERGVSVFAVGHGNAPALNAATDQVVAPGYTVFEIAAQVHRAARVIKALYPSANTSLYGMKNPALVASGGSSGGALSLMLAVGIQSESRLPYYTTPIDTVDSRVSGAVVNTAGGSGFDFAGLGDTSWFWRHLAYFDHVSLTAVIDPVTHMFYPAPPFPLLGVKTVRDLFSTNDGTVPNTGVYYNAARGFGLRIFPQWNYNPATYVLENWTSQRYPPIDNTTFPAGAPLVNLLRDLMPTIRLQNNLSTGPFGPVLMQNGDDDHLVELNSAVAFRTEYLSAGGSCVLRVYAEEGHSRRDVRREGTEDAIRFVLSNFAGPGADDDADGLSNLGEAAQPIPTDPAQWDTDGDLRPDGSEVAAGTNPSDPSSALEFTSVAARPGSVADTMTVDLAFRSVSGLDYVIQRATALAGVVEWADFAAPGNPHPIPGNGAVRTVTFTDVLPVVGESVMYRVRPYTSGFDRSVSAPVGVSRLLVERSNPVQGRTYVHNYLCAPFQDAPIARWVVSNAASVANDQFVVPASYALAPNAYVGSGGAPTHVVMVTRDRDHRVGESHPDAHGDEGRWWIVTGNTSNTVTVQLHAGEASVASSLFPATSPSVGCSVALIPLASLKTVFGELPATMPSGASADPGEYGFAVHKQDSIVRWNNVAARETSVPFSAPSGWATGTTYRVRAKSDLSGWEWYSTGANAAVLGDGSSVKILPDEVFRVRAIQQTTAETPIPLTENAALCAGFAPECASWAYLQRRTSAQENVPGWPFPVGVQLFEPNLARATSHLVDNGSVGVDDANAEVFRYDGANLAASDHLLFTSSYPIGLYFTGDDGLYELPDIQSPNPFKCYGFMDTRTPDGSLPPWAGHPNADFYWLRPRFEQWYADVPALSNTSTLLTVFQGDFGTDLEAGRGVTFVLASDADVNDHLWIWKRSLPYRPE